MPNRRSERTPLRAARRPASPRGGAAKPFSAIFDMDGVLVDNIRYHFRAWREFARRRGVPFDETTFRNTLFGKTNPPILRGLLGEAIGEREIEAWADEKEALYRELHRGRVRPARGLVRLLDALRAEGVTMAVATAAPRANMDFVLAETGLAPYFRVLVDAGQVRRGKPDPEIYLAAAARLRRAPRLCVAFEDSFPGIRAARDAGMKVVGVSTTHAPDELSAADLVVADFRGLTPDRLRRLVYPES